MYLLYSDSTLLSTIILVPQSGIEPTSPAYKTGPHPIKVSGAYMVPGTGLEPVSLSV